MKKIYLILILLSCFTSLFAQAPVISTFSPAKGPIGTLVTITGSNFNTTPASNIVYFGTNRATVTAATATQLTVTAPAFGGNLPISVLNTGTALSGYALSPFMNTFPSKNKLLATDFDTRVDIGTTTDAKIKGPQNVYFADLDGDGNLDMIICNSTSLSTAAPYTYTVSVLLNNLTKGAALNATTSFNGTAGVSKITLAASTTTTSGVGPFGVAVGDFDGDGKPDIVVSNNSLGTISIFRNTSTAVGNISFTQVGTDLATAAGAKNVVIGDYDKDGKPDIAVACSAGAKVCVFPNTTTAGAISFGTRIDLSPPAGSGSVNIAQADLDGDGKVDLAVVNALVSSISFFRNTSTPGAISFEAAYNQTTALTGVAPTSPYGLSIGDLDGDGKPDVVATMWSSGISPTNNIVIFRNTATAGAAFTSSSFAGSTVTDASNTYGVALGDMDGDGKLDLIVANYNGSTVGLYRNSTTTAGTITFEQPSPLITIATAAQPTMAFIGDFDGDGKPDMALPDAGTTAVSLFHNAPSLIVNTSTGAGTYTTSAASAGAAVAVDNALVVVDKAGTALPGATITVQSFLPEDVLAFNNTSASTMGNITGTYSSATGVLSLASAGSTATLAQWQTALRAVTYSNTSLTPATLSKVITFSVSDGATVSGASPKALNINYKSNVAVNYMAVSGGTLTPAFANGTKTYSINVPNASGSLTVTTTLNDALATLTVNGVAAATGAASGPVQLNVGSNPITIIVTAQDGTTTSTYNLTVNRAPSANANLSAIALSSGTLSPAFASTTNAYTALVGNAVTSVTLTLTAEDATASNITVNGTPVVNASASAVIPLVVGNNVITTIVTAQDGTTTNTYTVTVTRAPSSNANLTNLTVTHGFLTPAFASGTNTYNADVTSTLASVAFVPVLADATATITINGVTVSNNTLSVPVNLTGNTTAIPVVVTAQDGTTMNTYTVNVNKVVLSTNASLSALSLSSGTLSPTFDGATTLYTAAVANSTTTIKATATVANAGATKVTVNGNVTASGAASGNIALNVGNNTITVIVTAADSVTTQTYTVTVNRAASANADLSALAVSSTVLSPAFNSATTSYTATVSSLVSSVTITPAVADNTATLTVNGVTTASGSASAPIALSPGLNVLTVKVTSQNGTIKTYTVNLTQIVLSNNANLAGLTVSSGTLTPAFISSTTSYSQSVVNAVSSITVTPTLAFANATITVNGINTSSGSASTAVALGAGLNTVNVIVTAEDHIATKIYTLNITRLQLTQTITIAATNAVTYGAADYTPTATSDNSTIAITYTSSNAAVATVVAGKIHVVGAGITTITASQAANTTYSAATPVAQVLTVTPAVLAVAANNQSKIYGAANPTLTASYTGFVNGDDASKLTTLPTLLTTATPASLVGSYTITASAVASPNYTFTYANGSLSVTPAPLKITANNQTKIYGDANPALTASYTGFVNNDDATKLTTQPVLTTTATTTSPVVAANYPIAVSGAASANYTITYAPGILTVTPAPLTITANNLTKIYLAANPALTVTYTGFKGTDNNTTLISQPVLNTTATIASIVGSYPITVTGAVANTNYTLTMVNGTLTVGTFARIITFNPLNPVIYGDPDFVLTATVNTTDAVTYTSSNTAIATIINGNTVHIVGAGNVNIIAAVPANINYSGALTASQSLAVGKANQVITFAPIPNNLLKRQVTAISATSSLGAAYPVTFTSGNTHVATVFNNGGNTAWSISPLDAGTTVITAIQAGDNNYLPATATQTLTILPDDITINAALSPNGDGVNDYFLIDGIENYPNNKLTIFNRNGTKIYEKVNYDNVNNLFDGHSSITGAMMQQGSYFYILEYSINPKYKSNQKTGYIILKY